ncbi:uncharacterized protein UDID_07116 [Ustilago sp. UG-2017a]|nr:uncharacterized protein UDID_07116 [Ustilago sp. UG-2017a]
MDKSRTSSAPAQALLPTPRRQDEFDTRSHSSQDETYEQSPPVRSRRSSSISFQSGRTETSPRDLEAAQDHRTEKLAQVAKKGEEEEETDPNLVTWDSPDSQENPRNWSKRHRWAVTSRVRRQVERSVEQSMMLSTFVLAFAFGPMVLAPLTEMFGCRIVLQTSNVMFIAFNLGCGASQSSAQLMVLRFFAGLGGSAPLAVGGGTIADLFEPEERGSAMGLYSLAPLLGPAIGPIVGGWIVQELNEWRWIFWISSMYGGLTALIGVLLLPETYPPEILKRKACKLRKETGNQELCTAYEKRDASAWYENLCHNMVRPFVLLETQPIIQVLAIYMAILYGCMYILLTVFAETFGKMYKERPGIASLNYISLAIGFTLGGQIGGRVVDYSYGTLTARRPDKKGQPEFKLPLLMATSVIFPAGLLIYSWTTEYKTHWIGPNIGAGLFATGTMATFLVCQSYLVDVLPLYAASVLAAAVFVRSLGGFAFPFFAPSMYRALVSAVIGIPSPYVLYKFGRYLRAKSRYAAGDRNAARMNDTGMIQR